jgi:hypothetical protein
MILTQIAAHCVCKYVYELHDDFGPKSCTKCMYVCMFVCMYVWSRPSDFGTGQSHIVHIHMREN